MHAQVKMFYIVKHAILKSIALSLTNKNEQE